MNQHFEEIKKQFASTLKMKERGDTLEIITPLVTTNRKFVSVFISMYEGQFVVSDGGSIDNGFYDVEPTKSDWLSRSCHNYADSFGVKQTRNQQGVRYNYKKCADAVNIASLVLDVASFIVLMVSNIDSNSNK